MPYDDVVELLDLTSQSRLPRPMSPFGHRGANDIAPTRPPRPTRPSPIYGMPILDVEQARTVLFIKRSLASEAVCRHRERIVFQGQYDDAVRRRQENGREHQQGAGGVGRLLDCQSALTTSHPAADKDYSGKKSDPERKSAMGAQESKAVLSRRNGLNHHSSDPAGSGASGAAVPWLS